MSSDEPNNANEGQSRAGEAGANLTVGLGGVFDIPDFLRNPENLAKEREMEKTKIDNMVDRFLAWKLPNDFAPDHYISFDRVSAERLRDNTNGNAWPVGTNLFSADQARAMIEYLLAETPNGPLEAGAEAAERRCSGSPRSGG